MLIPLLFMGDIVGRLFREFAVTLSVTILMSAIVSLTLTPMMSARLLKHTPESSAGTASSGLRRRAFNKVIDFYGRTLKFVLRFQTITLLVALATLLLTIFLFYEIPKGFFPIQDTGVIQGVTEAAQSVSFSEMSRLQQSVVQDDSEGPGGREPVFVHRDRWHEHDAEQRTRADQSEASRPTEDQRQRYYSADAAGASRKFPASRFTCSRCRI